VAQGRKSTARTSSPPGPTETSEVSDSLSFEGALGELEAALTLFERGVNLSRQCSSTLESAERRIEILVAGREGELAEPFEMDGLDEDEDEDDDEFED
jgi:exodeoxyribonuclease VII small subunit